jgi:O-antigen ligase
MVGASAGRIAAKGQSASARRGGLIMGAATGVFLTVGIALTRSMAGYGLFLFSAIASILIYRRAAFGPLTRRSRILTAVLPALFLVGALIGPVSQESLSSEFSEDPGSRGSIAKTTFRAIEDSFPAGTGLGTFGDIYRRYEDADRPVPDFTNHAHNDYLEFILELGLAGVLVILGFIVWWLRRSLRAWRDDYKGATLARAGSIVIGIVLVHSLVDYPIRTSAIASIFALACALLLQPRGGNRTTGKEVGPTTNLRHLEAA